MSQRTPIDKLVEAAADRVIRRTKAGTYWTVAEVEREALTPGHLATLLDDLGKRYGPSVPDGPWQIDKIVRRYITSKIRTVLGARDEDGIRLYECFKDENNKWRWMRLSAMTERHLRAAMEQTRTLERLVHRKGEGYHILLEQLENAGEGATVGDVWPTARPLIMAYRAKAKTA